MMRTPSTGALTDLEAALGALLDGVLPVAPRFVPLDEARGRVAAKMAAVAPAQPERDIAATDGWACRAADLLGASAYSPLALPSIPIWVETGDTMPEGRDCVLQADLVDCGPPMALALGEATPGQGVRRMGEDMAAGSPLTMEGKMIGSVDLLVARKAGLNSLPVRSPRVRLVEVAAANDETFALRLVAECLEAAGATVAAIEATARDTASIAAALDGGDCDLLLLIGGTGDGRFDGTAEALAQRGRLIAHHIAFRPGRTTAIGRHGSTPVIALPGSPGEAFGGFLGLVQPVLERLSLRSERTGVILPLSRKISSIVGLSEIVLLARDDDRWTPLAIGDFPLDAMQLADAWLVIRGGSEGYAAGTPVAAFPLRN